ncbi:MAG: IS1 family transposase [Spirochaetaceae bacterium]|nr:IS1 family transposase [Spirochaetaceae bacterium]
MNKLPTEKRAQIIGMLVEGMSMRSITRLTGVSINTVTKLLRDAGAAADAYHHAHVRGVKGRRHIQCDEIWSFVYGKEGNVETMKSPPPEAGDVWTFTALDTDSKVILSYVLGPRDGRTALDFMDDLRGRVDDRPQISTDGLKAYVEAVDDAFGATADFAQIIKTYGRPEGVDDERRYSPAVCSGIEKTAMRGQPDMRKANTSHVERHNLTIRMSNRRFARLTNAFSKKLENHCAMLSLYFLHYNFCRQHKTTRVTPAMEAGIETTFRDHEWIVGLIDAMAPEPAPWGSRKKSNSK